MQPDFISCFMQAVELNLPQEMIEGVEHFKVCSLHKLCLARHAFIAYMGTSECCRSCNTFLELSAAADTAEDWSSLMANCFSLCSASTRTPPSIAS